MQSVEEEVDKLHEEITRFLNEEGGGESDDEDAEASSAPRARPGAITPLGVRVDRGAGLLGVNGATATIGEMDSVLNNIRAWKQKHEREMLELRQRNEQALSHVAAAAAQPDEHTGAGAATSGPGSPGNPVAAMLLLPPPPPPPGGAPSGTSSRPASTTSSAVTPGGNRQGRHNHQHDSLQGACSGVPPQPLQLGEEDDEDLAELLRERRERRDRIVSGTAAVARRQLAAASLAEAGAQPAGHGQDDSNGDAGLQLAALPASRVSAAGSASFSSQPWSSAGQPPLESVLRVTHPGPSLPEHLLGPLPGERPNTVVRRKADEAASAALLRGQHLLAELEAELQQLEGSGGGLGGGGSLGGRGSGGAGIGPATLTGKRPGSSGPRSGGVGNGLGRSGGSDGIMDGGAAIDAMAAVEPSLHVESLVEWSAELQSVLAKMDALQTGYQAAAAAAVAVSEPCGGGSRPRSGGTSTRAGTGPGGSPLAARPGSARLRLEPLPRAPGLSTGGMAGQGRAPGLGTVAASMTLVGSAATAGSGKGSCPAAFVGKGRGTGGAGDANGGSAEPRSGKSSAGGSAGWADVVAGSAMGGTDGEELGPAAVACAGHRIRQLRELQRQAAGAGGVDGGGAAAGGAGGSEVAAGDAVAGAGAGL